MGQSNHIGNIQGDNNKIRQKNRKISISIGSVVIIAIFVIVLFNSKEGSIKNKIAGTWDHNGRTVLITKGGTLNDSISGKWGPCTYTIEENKIIISGIGGVDIYKVSISGDNMVWVSIENDNTEEFTRIKH